MNFYCNIPEAIQRHAQHFPERIAVEFRGSTISYGQLQKMTDQIAAFLSRQIGGQANIAVAAERTPNTLISILGIMKANCVFVPLDTRYPAERLKHMVHKSDCKWIISDSDKLAQISDWLAGIESDTRIAILHSNAENDAAPLIEEWTTMHSNRTSSDLSSYPTSPDLPSNRMSSDSLLYLSSPTSQLYLTSNQQDNRSGDHAYIYFTSGSTGKPKGILGKHKSLAHFIDWEVKQFNLDESTRVSQLTSPSFDPYLRDIFVPLYSGGTVCIPDDYEMIINPLKLLDWINRSGVTLLHMVPTLFRALMQYASEYHFRYVKHIFLAGERLKGTDLHHFYNLYGSRIQIVNLYGPTETTLAKAFYLVQPKDSELTNIPIGKPLPDTEFFLLDSSGQRCGIGGTGEIYIRTAYGSAGYWDDAEETLERFVANPEIHDPEDIFYRTGDIGRQLSDGSFECIGRTDDQVKIRGIRIELPEIEQSITRVDGVTNAVVSVKSNGESKLLCAYFTAERLIGDEEFKKFLLRKLPNEMIPAYFIQMDALPLLPNGKTNKKALPDPASLMGTAKKHIPANETEAKVKTILQNILAVDYIHAESTFIALGGNSLDAAMVSMQINKEFGVETNAADILRHDTLFSLAGFIDKASEKSRAAIPVVDASDVYPVSSAQSRILMAHLIDNTGIAYNIPECVLLEGEIEREKLENSFRSLVRRHESLRTSFQWCSGKPVQRIHLEVPFHLRYVEGPNRNSDLLPIIVQKLMEDFVQPFHLEEAPLLRAQLVTLEKGRHLLMWDTHHIVCDGISQKVFKHELTALYNDGILPEISLTYKDYACWHHHMLERGLYANQEKYWMSEFSGDLALLELPTDYTRPTRQSFSGESIPFYIEHDLTDRLREISHKTNSTLYMILLTAFYILLSKYTGQEEIRIGTPIANRNRAELGNIIGMFVNNLVICGLPAGELSFLSFLKHVKNRVLAAFENQDVPFDRLVDSLNIPREPGRSPLFNVMFMMQNIPVEELRFEGIHSVPQRYDKRSAKFDLTLTVEEKDNGLECSLEFAASLFNRDTIIRMKEAFIAVIQQISVHSEMEISEMQLLIGEERRQVLETFNQTSEDYLCKSTIHEEIMRMATVFPYSIALIAGGKRLTYRELNDLSDGLAGKLLERGVTSGSVVGVMAHRTAELIIGMIAVLKAGGAYLPIDPEYPHARVAYMIEDSKCDLLLSESAVMAAHDYGVDWLDLLNQENYSSSHGLLADAVKSTEVAYVIYTSGSTGTPKGVMCEHRNVINFFASMRRRLGLTNEDIFLALTTLSFDIFVLETLLPLASGCRVVVADENEQRDGRLIGELIQAYGVNIMQVTPSRLEMYLQTGFSLEDFPTVNKLLIGGEPFPPRLFKQVPVNLNIYNLYGPTETTVWSTMKALKKDERITVGKPIFNTFVYIVDKYGQPVPIGVQGELLIAGEGVTRGYLGRPELTAERFMECCFRPGQRMYRTGDLARWLPNGEIDVIGRLDYQVKHHGYRIELGEIEACILEFHDIVSCVCMIREKETSQLIAYYVSESPIHVTDLRKHLLMSLPKYMVPEHYIWLERLPITPNGKLDRKALPDPGDDRPMLETVYEEAVSQTERRIQSIWSAALKKDNIGIHDNFFDLGGNSLLLVHVYRSLEEWHPGVLTIADLFAYPSISKLTQFINSKQEANSVKHPGKMRENQARDSDDGSILFYRLERSEMQQLDEVARLFDVEKQYVLCALYVYLLCDLFQKDHISLLVFEENGDFAAVNFDLSEINAIEDLIQQTSLALKQSGANFGRHEFKKPEVSILDNETKEIIPAFGPTETNTALEDSDVLLTYDMAGTTAMIYVEFNPDILRLEEVENWFNRYVRFFYQILHQFQKTIPVD
ncbi:non-ribosomal peptide synthetase [Paenibacillus sp.]|jgi:amino acid adenylation domain-containing protein|uniref:non-ribosomal peptide synthetase n=1 Tax=Paenibacillus sp. TaxID=58172 RepID=UPI002819CEF4|nr:non-ribosomal peptide synthetase [Paenibacillus sp.]MDR0270275.1 amino acid adenylation domain-containing protein [Paenibacillus sp.]